MKLLEYLGLEGDVNFSKTHIADVEVNRSTLECSLKLEVPTSFSDKDIERFKSAWESYFPTMTLNLKITDVAVDEFSLQSVLELALDICTVQGVRGPQGSEFDYDEVNHTFRWRVGNQIQFDRLNALAIDKRIAQGIKERWEKDVNLLLEWNDAFNPDKFLAFKEEQETVMVRYAPPSQVKTDKKKSDATSKLFFGQNIKKKAIKMTELVEDFSQQVVEGTMKQIEFRTTRTGTEFLTFDLVSSPNAVSCKLFVPQEKSQLLHDNLIDGQEYRVQGNLRYDQFARTQLLFVESIASAQMDHREDNAKVKRTELVLHTKMTTLDGFVELKDLFKRLDEWGHTGVAITDAGSVQCYPEAYALGKKYNKKVLYGLELRLLTDFLPIAYSCDGKDRSSDVTVFDIETTGFSKYNDRITEIGAVRIIDGQIADTFQTLVNPEMVISEEITKLTGITNQMVHEAPTIDQVMGAFLDFSKNSVYVAHNANFDIGFISENCRRLGVEFEPSYIDTVNMGRALMPRLNNHKLNTLSKNLGVRLLNHHRASDDAVATSEVFLKLLAMVPGELRDLGQLNQLKTEWPKSRNQSSTIVLYVLNHVGLENLYHIVSEANMNFFFREPGITKAVLEKYREGLVLASGYSEGELFSAVKNNLSQQTIEETAQFYDCIQVEPIDGTQHLIDRGEVASEKHLVQINHSLIELGERFNKNVIAVGNVRYLDPNDYRFRKILIASRNRRDVERIPQYYMRTTQEMLDGFYYLEQEHAERIVLENPQKLMDSAEEITPIPNGTFPPIIEGSDNELRETTYRKATSIYGSVLPEIVEKRLERELNSIIANGYAVLYIISQKLVLKSNEDGYLVGSRGSVGSSFVATMADITEVNPLPPHYVCLECHHSDFNIDTAYQSGVDLPDKLCPSCGAMMLKDGHDIPFEVFLGFDGDKEPDIDLNFAGEYQPTIHQYTEEIFGKGNVFRAGTISAIKENTAYGYIKKYQEERDLTLNPAEIRHYQDKLVGVKRTTGQHPGGVMILPHNKDIHEFTPIQYPADDPKSGVITTHFSYKSLSGRILKLDLLGHDVPSIIRMLQDLTGIDPLKIPIDDEDTMNLFSSTESLNIKTAYSNDAIGTLGIPEFGTGFVRQMLSDTKPTTFAELVRISGLSHGTDVWLGNAQYLIQEGIAELKNTICTRDDIMIYLIQKGLDKKIAFQIMETVRKGKSLDLDTQDYMRSFEVPEWYIDSCEKIKYMFPKAHAVAYVLMSYRIAYFKVHHPLEFYATYYTTKIANFPYEIVRGGQVSIKSEMLRIDKLGKGATSKEKEVYSVLEVAEEMYARGFGIGEISIDKSNASRFGVSEQGEVIPPLSVMDGVSDALAEAILAEKENGSFISFEDFAKRTGATKTAVASIKDLGIMEGLQETNQLSFF